MENQIPKKFVEAMTETDYLPDYQTYFCVNTASQDIITLFFDAIY